MHAHSDHEFIESTYALAAEMSVQDVAALRVLVIICFD